MYGMYQLNTLLISEKKKKIRKGRIKTRMSERGTVIHQIHLAISRSRATRKRKKELGRKRANQSRMTKNIAALKRRINHQRRQKSIKTTLKNLT